MAEGNVVAFVPLPGYFANSCVEHERSQASKNLMVLVCFPKKSTPEPHKDFSIKSKTHEIEPNAIFILQVIDFVMR